MQKTGKYHTIRIFLPVAVLLLLCIVSGCTAASSNTSEDAGYELLTLEEIDLDELTPPSQDTGPVYTGPVFFDAFDLDLVESDLRAHPTENRMVSPLSLKFALGLLEAGAGEECKKEILQALGKETEEEMERELRLFQEFSGSFRAAAGNKEALCLTNSIWTVDDGKRKFSKLYREKAEQLYQAEARSEKKEHFAENVNRFVADKTNNMIRDIIPADYDLNNTAAALVNTLYLNDVWEIPVYSHIIMFNDIEGNRSEKEAIHSREYYRYYEDEGGKLVILPMKHGISAVFVLGDTGDLNRKIASAEKWKTDVEIPFMDFSTSVSSGELKDFLESRGMKKSFRVTEADFSPMMDGDDVYVESVLQKTKIKLDEKGMEAAAATTVVMVSKSASPMEEEYKTFYADEPFSFYIYADANGEGQILFGGRMVK